MRYLKKHFWILLITILLGVFIGQMLLISIHPNTFASNPKKEKLNRLIDYIDHAYVDKINTDSIVDVTVKDILSALDPHSVYIPKRQRPAITESMLGDFVGIGISFYIYNDSLAVIRPLDGSPSKKAGIQAGDRILVVNNDTLVGDSLTSDLVVKKLKGPLHSTVHLKIHRKNTPELLNFSIKRSKIPIQSVDAAYMLTDTLGYIKINRFAETTHNEFKTALEQLTKQGAHSMVLDLRDNPGGLLNAAEQIADEFLKDNTLIIFTKDRNDRVNKYFATETGNFEKGKVYVLINENSASASEVVAGALQDNDRATVVGRRSYGKGLVQKDMSLGDGSVVRLTVSRYYTPTGRSIQRPYNKGRLAYDNEYIERLANGELTDAANIKPADSLKFKTPQGKILYGGGGITPDVFVSIDTTYSDKTLKFLQQRGVLQYFIFEQLEKNRTYYDTISKEQFIKKTTISNTWIQNFENELRTKTNLQPNFSSHQELVRHYIKSALAGQLYGNNAFYEIFNKTDRMLETVIKLNTHQ